MHDIFFKNITSRNKGQRVLSSLELSEQSGIRSQVHRHLVCRITEASSTETVLPKPTLYVLKKQDMKERLELFYCRIKGSMYVAVKDKLCLVSFINSLRIQLKPLDNNGSMVDSQ